MARYFSQGLIILTTLAFFAGCEPETSAATQRPAVPQLPALGAVKQLGVVSLKQIQQAEAQSAVLTSAVSHFLESPNEETRISAQQAWVSAHQSYVAAKFGMLEASDGDEDLDFMIDAWPMQPGFLDNLPDYPDSGIISDTSLVIDLDTFRKQQGITDDNEVCLGFHALEYLLYERPAADFISNDTIQIKRRRASLALIANTLQLDEGRAVTLIQNQYDITDEAGAQALLRRFVSSTLDRLQRAFQESSLMTVNDYGHSTFSKTSMQTLSAELDSLQRLTLTEVALRPILQQIDDSSVVNYEKTLEDALKISRAANPDEISRANLPLMLTALIHQWETFERLQLSQDSLR